MIADQAAAPFDRLAAELMGTLGADAVLPNEPLARHTALRVGGPADLLAVARSLNDLQQSVSLAWELGVPCRVLGAGSNVLVSDSGVQGLVVLNRARTISFRSQQGLAGQSSSPTVEADGGASLSTVARRCIMRGLAGLEWAATIPGTVGGAVVGNAGAWGGDIASALLRAQILEVSGEVAEWPVDRLQYGYRSSILKKQSSAGERWPVVLRAEFVLRPGDRDALEARVSEMTAQRKASQPAGASCGSVFRNPPGDYAGRLIESAGLKGASQGAAEISPVHANFIVNHGGARATDVRFLIDLARQRVRERFGKELCLEIQLIGRWSGEGSLSPAAWDGRQEPAVKNPSQQRGPART